MKEFILIIGLMFISCSSHAADKVTSISSGIYEGELPFFGAIFWVINKDGTGYSCTTAQEDSILAEKSDLIINGNIISYKLLSDFEMFEVRVVSEGVFYAEAQEKHKGALIKFLQINKLPTNCRG